MPYIKTCSVRKAIKEQGFRVSKDFVEALDRKVSDIINESIENLQSNDPKRKTVKGEDINA